MAGHSICIQNVMFSGKKYRSMKREKKRQHAAAGPEKQAKR
jgi:hypothetical protein